MSSGTRKSGSCSAPGTFFGIKPFYYYDDGKTFLFGSEIKSFLEHPGFHKELDEEKIPEYLSYEYIPTENTIFKNVYKLPGAHCLTYRDGRLKVERYYSIQYRIEEDKPLEYWEEQIQKEFAESVSMHQIADVEVGCFLSSGVDSSYVVREISKGTEKVKTFSVGYEEEKYSELPYAQEFSRAVGVPNISNKVDADDFFDAMPTIQYMLDEPLPNPSEIPLYFLAQNARKYVKVVLSGEGPTSSSVGTPCTCRAGTSPSTPRRSPARCGSWPAPWPESCRSSRASTSWCGAVWSPTSALCGQTTCSPTPTSARST